MTFSFFYSHYIKKKLYKKFVMLEYEAKRKLILQYKNAYQSLVFVETGTFLGDTVAAMRPYFSKIYTIELQKDLAARCIERFKNDNLIEVLQGDSAELISNILPKINANTLFWLDAHYSSEFYIGEEFIRTAKAKKETPIIEEIQSILDLGLKNNVILIDDARCFNGENDYPTINQLKALLNKKGIKNRQIKVKRDVIRIIPE